MESKYPTIFPIHLDFLLSLSCQPMIVFRSAVPLSLTSTILRHCPKTFPPLHANWRFFIQYPNWKYSTKPNNSQTEFPDTGSISVTVRFKTICSYLYSKEKQIPFPKEYFTIPQTLNTKISKPILKFLLVDLLFFKYAGNLLLFSKIYFLHICLIIVT